LLAAPLAAANLQVTPVRTTLQPDAKAAVVTVQNQGTDDTLVQLSIVAWRQENGEDRMEPTRDLLLNPSIFLVKAGEQQIVRFALRVPHGTIEQAYRAVLQEVPQQHTQGVTTLLRMLMPIFVMPTVAAAPAVDFRLLPSPKGIDVVAHNGGNVHVQLTKVRLTVPGQPEISKAVNIHVLPGATRTFHMEGKPAAAESLARIVTESDQGGFSADVRVGAAVPVPAGHQ
jgi:fimbrial chaperone protein